MARYTYRVAVMAAHVNYSLSSFTPDQSDPVRSYKGQGVLINNAGISFCAGISSIMREPIDQWKALSQNEDYAIAAAGSFFHPLTGSPAVPYGGTLDAGQLAREIGQYIAMQQAARAHGHDYDNSRTILQIVRGDLDVADCVVFALANRVENSRFAVYRGTRDQLACVWEGSEEEFWTRYRAASEKVRADEDYVARYQEKWRELRRENIATLLPDLARKDGVLLMAPEEFSKWQTTVRRLVCPTPEQVRRALDAPAQIETAQTEAAPEQIETAQIETAQIETAPEQIETAQIETAQIETAQIETAQTEAAPEQIETAQIETAQIDSTPEQIEAAQHEATPEQIASTPEQRERNRQEKIRALYARLCAMDERTRKLEAEKIEGEKIEAEQIETAQIETAQTETAQSAATTEQIEAEKIETAQTEAAPEQVEAEKKPRRSRRRAKPVTVAQAEVPQIEQVEQA